MEADIIGMDLAARACFDPAAGKHVFTRLGEIERRMGADRMPSLLRTHPVSVGTKRLHTAWHMALPQQHP